MGWPWAAGFPKNELRDFISKNGLLQGLLCFQIRGRDVKFTKRAGYGLANNPKKELTDFLHRIRLAQGWLVFKSEAKKSNLRRGLADIPKPVERVYFWNFVG